MLNTSILMGRLVRDVEVRTVNGKAVASFTVAVNSKHQKDKSNFIPCTAWGKTAEFIGKYFGKGSMIAIEGEIVTGKYEKDGRTVYTVEVNVERASFTGERRDVTPQPEAPESFAWADDFTPF